MAIRPDYDIGTVTLVASSANFTTSGSALQTAAVQAGDAIIAPSGHVLIIASITGQNSGTLFLPCPAAAAGSGLALRIRFQPDGSRYQGAVRVLIDLLSSGNIEAFAALVGSAGLVPIFTGIGTMDLADPATFGIQDPNGNLGQIAALNRTANMFLFTGDTGNFVLSDPRTTRAALGATGNLFKVSYVTASGTFAYDSATKLAEVILIGGGASGAACGSNGTTQAGATGGGGAGGMVYRLIENPPSTATITIGGGGALVSSSGGLPTAGNNGGNSTYTATGVSLTAGGGGGALQTFASSNVVAGSGGAGGSASGGHLNILGENGKGSISMGLTAVSGGTALGAAGDGGSTPYGVGGFAPRISSTAAAQGNGASGSGYGAGSSGGVRMLVVGNSFSDAGRPGICIIKEYK